jgi:L-ascorbate metabolism protein UlaG (beta-lactamase superfamily)
MQLKPAAIKDEQLIEEVEQYTADEKNFYLWWLGQSGYLLLWKGQKLLIDPYLSDSLTKKYANTGKQHIRMSERVINPALLTNIAIVTSSHNHTDHLDGETLIPLIHNNPHITFVIPEANRQFVSERVKIPEHFAAGLAQGQQITAGEFTFYGIPAKHNEIETDEKGNCRFMGYVISFGQYSIYHSGDTLWFDEMVPLLQPFNINVALLPINGNDPARGVAGNLNGKEAATLGKAIGAQMVIPCHYDMFTFNTASTEEFEQEAEKLQQPYTILPQGGHFSSKQLKHQYA